MVKISVIIPVFGVESFVGRCVDSLLGQSLEEGIEFIFVDDASKDSSRSIIESKIAQYPNRRRQVKIITHECNKGLPAARNTGLSVATGEYIYHFDGDDYADCDLLENLLTTAEEENADYIWSDYYISYQNNERRISQPITYSIDEALHLMMSGVLKYNVWNKLVKRSIYLDSNIQFPEGYGMGEDMTMIRLLVASQRIFKSPAIGYHYVKTNSEAMTQCYTEQNFSDLKYNVHLTSEFIFNKSINNGHKLVKELELSSKYHLLYTGKKKDYLLWGNLWPESNSIISISQGFRPWLIQSLAKYKIWPLLKLYYYLYDFLYRKVYI